VCNRAVDDTIFHLVDANDSARISIITQELQTVMFEERAAQSSTLPEGHQ
jgi:hypothetical protein